MNYEAEGRRIVRQDDIEIKLPFGVTVRASGKQVTLIILVVLGAVMAVIALREHDTATQKATGEILLKQQEVVESLDNVGYILTLKQDEREALKLTMPHKLRRQLQERN